MRKVLATASMLAILAYAPAMAQEYAPGAAPPKTPAAPPAAAPGAEAPRPATPAMPGVQEKQAKTSPGQWHASKLIGQTIRNSAKEPIGDISELLLDSSGNVTAVIVGVGGFLGIGEKRVALGFSDLSISRDENNRLVVMANTTKETLQAAPEWNDPDRRTERGATPPAR